MREVLDAHALLAFLEKEPSSGKVEAHFVAAVEKDTPIGMTCVNFGEVYCIILRECGPEKAAQAEKIIATLPIEIVTVDRELAREAARFKATKKMSYADCFAAALTKMTKAELITGDPEFHAVEKDIKIAWLT